ncbi:MAG: hypothetical protein PHF87_03385, partial [Desulfotomaculaceae bacterium]|nr:hypothetical protein [Desulfotomaculaceae bacterium]
CHKNSGRMAKYLWPNVTISPAGCHEITARVQQDRWPDVIRILSEVINGLREMNFYEVKGEGYIPTYTRTVFTDALHESFGFRTDYDIIKKTQMKKILSMTKK